MAVFTRNNIITRIKDFVGDEVTDIEGYKDIINAAFNHVADLIPVTSEIWTGAPRAFFATFIAAFINVSRYKVIAITRKDSNGIERVCKEVTFEYLQRGEDTTSIYYNAGSYRNPIYSFNPAGMLTVKPVADDPTLDVLVYYYIYLTNEDITGEVDGSSFYFPEGALYLAILKAASNLLQAMVSQAVQEEEDNELLGLLNGQMASIDKSMQVELQALGLPFKLIGDGNDIE